MFLCLGFGTSTLCTFGFGNRWSRQFGGEWEAEGVCRSKPFKCFSTTTLFSTSWRTFVLGDSHFLAFTNFFLAAFALKHFFILFTTGEIPYLMNSPMTLKVQSKASKPMKQYTRKHDTALKAVSSSVGEAGLNYWRVYSNSFSTFGEIWIIR